MPGHATSTSYRLCRDIPVAQGPDISYCTPSALHQCGGQWFLAGSRGVVLKLICLRFLQVETQVADISFFNFGRNAIQPEFDLTDIKTWYIDP